MVVVGSRAAAAARVRKGWSVIAAETGVGGGGSVKGVTGFDGGEREGSETVEEGSYIQRW